MKSSPILFSCLLLAAFSMPAQEDEARSYFSLSTQGPVGPGEEIKVSVSSYRIPALEFRLYAVKDPVKFFEGLDNPHSSGRAQGRRPRPRTPIERFAAWRRSVRSFMRDLVRQQYGAEQRAEIRTWMTKKEEGPQPKAEPASKKATGFAQVPLLNPDQLLKTWRETIPQDRMWQSTTVSVKLDSAGLYLLEATEGRRRAYAVLSATTIAVLSKGEPGQMRVRVVDRETGRPLEGANVRMFDSTRKELLHEQKTAADGMGGWKTELDHPQGVLVTATHNGRFAVTTVDGWSLNGSEERMAGYVYTDRPVYRPGHPVRAKAILRRTSLEGYLLPEEPEAEIEISGPSGQTIQKRKARLTDAGSISTELTLPADAEVGYYSIRAGSGTSAVHGSFQVEEYRKPDYEVRVQPEQSRILQGDTAVFNVSAKYYYGEPVVKAKVEWTLMRSRFWPYWYARDDEEDFGEFGGGGGEPYYGSDAVEEGTGELDAEGRLTVRVPAGRAEFDSRLFLRVEVTDASGRGIFGGGSVLATRGNFLIMIQPVSYVNAEGERAKLRVETRTYDGARAANIPFTVSISRYHYRRALKPIAELSGTTGADGSAVVETPALEAGYFTARAKARSEAGVEIDGSTYIWVSGAELSGPGESQVEIVPDKKKYEPGDKARFLLITGGPAHVWFSIEGRGVHAERLLEVKSASAVVEIPVEQTWAPNVYANAVFVRANGLHVGTKLVKVALTKQQFKVDVTPDKPTYKPGEPATFRVKATGSDGKPVSAEFSVGVVDEAIYAIANEPQPDISEVFYGRQWNRVSSDSSLSFHFYSDSGMRPVNLAMASKGARRYAQLKPERVEEPRIRKDFPDTAFWTPELVTGANGTGEVRFAFPDSLTTWRTTARGVTSDTRVGQAVAKTLVRKNVIVSIAAPRFFTEGDEITVPVVVRNWLPGAIRTRVSLDATGLELVNPGSREIEVASRGEASVEYRARVKRGDQVDLLAKALSGAESDAIELKIPILQPGLEYTRTRAGALDNTTAAAEYGMGFDARAYPNSRRLEIEVTPSAAGSLFSALEYLTTFPYGCTEQTMSGFLPNVFVSEAAQKLNLAAPLDEKDLRKKVEAGIERLRQLQHSDGGWGWWETDETDAFMTAYVAWGLKSASQAGYGAADGLASQAAKALRNEFENPKPGGKRVDIRAWQLHALSQMGEAKAADFESVWAQRTQLSSLGWALLGLSAQSMKIGRVQEIALQLEMLARRDGSTVWWPSDRDLMLDFDADSSVESTAFALRFLTKEDPSSPLLAPAVRWLLARRNQGPSWRSTKETAFALFGLVEYVSRSKELEPDFTLRATVNGREVMRRRFTAADVFAKPAKLTLTAAETGNDFKVRFEISGPGRAYFTSRTLMRLNAGPVVEPAESTLSLKREYYRVASVREGNRIVYDLVPFDGQAQPGDLLAVRLSVSGMAYRYVLIEDSLPSGAEVLPREDLYEIRGQPRWWRWMWQRRQVRDSKVGFLESWLPKEGGDFIYMFRVTNAGTLQAPPARVEPMYQPEVFSSSAPAVLKVGRQ